MHFIKIAHTISKEAREFLKSKAMEAYNKAFDEQHSESETESMSEDESENLMQSI